MDSALQTSVLEKSELDLYQWETSRKWADPHCQGLMNMTFGSRQARMEKKDGRLSLVPDWPTPLFLPLTWPLQISLPQSLSTQGWCLEPEGMRQSRSDAALRNSASAESRTAGVDGALVCQVSLLDSVCQRFAVSDEAQTPEPSCWHTKVIYCSCWQGLVRGCCSLSGP